MIYLGLETGPKGACVPSLGLSNKAVYSSDNKNGIPIDSKNGYPEESYFSETHMTGNSFFNINILQSPHNTQYKML